MRETPTFGQYRLLPIGRLFAVYWDMTLPVQMTIRGAQHSSALEEAVQRRAQKLETFSQAITGCRVTFEISDTGGGSGHSCDVLLMVALPGDCLVVRHRCRNQNEGDAYHCVNQIFSLAERAVRKHERRRRGSWRYHDGGITPQLAGGTV